MTRSRLWIAPLALVAILALAGNVAAKEVEFGNQAPTKASAHRAGHPVLSLSPAPVAVGVDALLLRMHVPAVLVEAPIVDHVVPRLAAPTFLVDAPKA